jgi:hypothetical protein
MILITAISLGYSIKTDAGRPVKKKFTIMCYMNGDNDLAGEILHAVDMMETVGSSQDIDIFALVDGSPGDNGGYGHQWEGTRLLHITKDDQVGTINSTIIEELGEQNLGAKGTLEKFIRTCIQNPSEKYIFILFAHGRGIIDTKRLDERWDDSKSLSLSPDETGRRAMNHQEFREALEKGLSGKKFELVVLFSCLNNMVEVGYELKDVTRWMIGSEDEIRILNDPPGRFQIRGIKLEQLIEKLQSDPKSPVLELGRVTIDSFIEQYENDIVISGDGGSKKTWKYAAGLSLVDCQKYGNLSRRLDLLADLIIKQLQCNTSVKDVLKCLQTTLSNAQRYPSFLNLEYFDLQDFLELMGEHIQDTRIKALCEESISVLNTEVILYEKHTDLCRSNGVSIFLPNFLVPENIYQFHMKMYQSSRFSKDTTWDEMIDIYRAKMLERHAEIMLDEFEKAYLRSDFASLESLHSRLPWALREDVLKGNYSTTERYLKFVEKTAQESLAGRSLVCLYEALQIANNNSGLSQSLIRKVETLIGYDNAHGSDGL